MTTTAKKRNRLVGLKLSTAAGVDHGANAAQMGGAEGWAVMKADGTYGKELAFLTRALASPKRPAKPAPAPAPGPPDCCLHCGGGGVVPSEDGTEEVPCPVCADEDDVVATKSRPRPAAVTKSAAWTAIAAAAGELRKSTAVTGSALTQEQAVARVEIYPELAAAWRTAAPDKAAPFAPVVKAVRPGDGQAAALDLLADKLAQERGIPKVAAYEVVAASPIGEQLVKTYKALGQNRGGA